MNREIPGFYYDSAKRKYFKIEDNKTAPEGASWSRGAVKRRALEKSEEEERKRKESRFGEGVRRARLSIGDFTGVGVSDSRRREEDLPLKVWASGLREKGQKTLWDVSFLSDEGVSDEGVMEGMWVGPQEDDEGADGVCFASWSESAWMFCKGVFRDGDDRITERDTSIRNWGFDIERLGAIVSIKFHTFSQTSIVTGSSRVIVKQPDDNSRLSGGDPYYPGLSYEIPNAEVHCCEISKLSNPNNVDAIFGSTRGLFYYQNYGIHELVPVTRSTLKKIPFHQRPPFWGDILSVDYLKQQDHNIILAGTRSGHICLIDRRTSPKEWESNIFRHKSSVAHVKSLLNSPHEVLAAGPSSAMAIYDIRFLRRQKQAEQNHHCPWNQTTLPIVNFPEYRNEAHIKTGLDILTDPGYGCGLVATAHDDCTIGVYSLRDGSRLPAGDVDKIKAQAVIRSLMWQKLPGDIHPSLFVGLGPRIKKYSFSGEIIEKF
ncbi:WD repeat-containing protein 21 [Podospora fimiseda]|uniref:WD repeat-containing protein 21 n=1 Tax=Podospora fimiseda TaxID=252190 RepID=A0AAN6YQT7_9PEZI|nr:WD repeat-containing protein 21 [Podospora fimiseda]